MKKTIWTTLVLVFFLSANAFAQDSRECFQPVDWSSTSSNDPVVINNASGVSILAVINVPGSGINAPGALLTNCGNTTRVDAGGTAICSNNDSNNPITITAENDNKPVKGTYQIKQLTTR